MMEPASVTATAASVVSIVQGISQAIQTAKKNLGNKTKVEAALSSLQDLTQSLQSAILEAQAQALELQEQNHQLREEARAHEEWALERQHYKREKVGQAVVFVRTGEEGVHYCPHCFQSKRFHQLHFDSTAMAGFSKCSVCEARFYLR